MSRRLSIWMKLLVGFFSFGAIACAVTTLLLLVPGSSLDVVWRLNPEAQIGFQQIGRIFSILLMSIVGIACACAAVGLARQRSWGRRLAIGILVVNMVGDFFNALIRHDLRTLIGLPIGGAIIAYLWKTGTRKGKE